MAKQHDTATDRPSYADLIDSPSRNVPAAAIDNRLFRRLAENIPILCWAANADGYIFWYNDHWHDYCGTTPHQMEGWGWQTVHDPDILPEVMARWLEAIATEQPFEMTFPLRGADGTYRPFLTRVHPYRAKDGTLTHWFGVNIDVAAQVEAAAKLKAANAEIAAAEAERTAVLQQLTDGVIVTDPEGRIVFVNDAAERLHGVAKLDVEPDHYAETYRLFTMDGELHATETLPLTRAVRDHEVVVDSRWRIRRPDGTDVMAIGSSQPFYGDDGAIKGAVLTIHDDTRRFADEIALQEALAIKEVLLSEVNHRVKNSLQLVTSLLSLQAATSESEALRQSLTDATARISIVAELHHRLYNTGEHDRVEITQYLGEIATKTVRALDRKNRIRIAFDCPVGLILKVDDAVPLALVVSELLTNAVKYAYPDKAHGVIHISVKADAETIEVRIKDDGRGLPADFELGSATSLGMRVVTALIGQIRGTLTIVERTMGCEFLIVLPSSLFVSGDEAV